jgi:hypothetical protein
MLGGACVRQRPQRGPALAVAPGHVRPGEPVRVPVGAQAVDGRAVAVEAVHPGDRRAEPDVPAPVQELGDQVGHQELLRVHGVDLPLPQLAVVQLELPVLAAERARPVGLPLREQPAGQPVLVEDTDAGRCEEPRPAALLHVDAGLPLQDHAADVRGPQHVPEHQTGRPGSDDHYLSPLGQLGQLG